MHTSVRPLTQRSAARDIPTVGYAPQPSHIYASALSRSERRWRRRRSPVRAGTVIAGAWLGVALWVVGAVLPGAVL